MFNYIDNIGTITFEESITEIGINSFPHTDISGLNLPSELTTMELLLFNW